MNEDNINEDYLYYSSPAYLGESGITQPCITAMAAILTSAFRPEKITAVLGDYDNYNHAAVLFLVWNWADRGLTIIPDGFGTHGGEGGAGLAAVLGLIKFYKIPLLQVRIQSKKAFNELAQGKLTEEMFDEVQQAQASNWNFYRASEVQKVKKGKKQFLEIKWLDGR